MRFSIREMLALTFLSVLAMLAWRTWRDVREHEALLTSLHNEIESLEATARLDQPALRQAIAHTRDQYQTLHAMRQRAEEHFEVLLEKYSVLQPPDTGTLALRSIPSLKAGPEPAPVVYRLMVPEQRPVWLKAGISLYQEGGSQSDALDDQRDWLTESPLSPSGPFEVQLRPGDQRLKIATGYAEDDQMPVELAIDDLVLLRAAFTVVQPSGKSQSRISAQRQINFDPNQPLPWLCTTQLQGPNPVHGDGPPLRYGFTLWFSDRPSGFSQFPDAAEPAN